MIRLTFLGTFFENIFGELPFFLWGHWYPCFGLLMTSALGFKARLCLFLVCFGHLCTTTDCWDSPLVRHLLTSWLPAWLLSHFRSTYSYLSIIRGSSPGSSVPLPHSVRQELNWLPSSYSLIENIKEWKNSTCWLVLVVLKIMVFSPFKLKVQIPYYYPLNQWLLGATNGNQGQIVMDLWSSKTINHAQWV